MELGNLIFGNSRGEYPLERGMGFEEELYRLFDAYAPQRDNSWREYGEEFENEIFSVFPYYWGECTCGFDNYEFTEKHSPNCFQTELKEEKLKSGWRETKYGYLEYVGSGLKFGETYTLDKVWKMEDEREKKIVKKLYEKRDWNTKTKGWWHGFAVRCDCDYYQRYEKWLKQIGYPDGHKEDCLLVKPNFLYKPTGLKIKWYKYPLRDAYISEKISLEEFRKIIDNCIKSISQNK